jgi:hypothetical protein
MGEMASARRPITADLVSCVITLCDPQCTIRHGVRSEVTHDSDHDECNIWLWPLSYIVQEEADLQSKGVHGLWWLARDA